MKTIKISGFIKRETARAVLFNDGVDTWIAKSQIKNIDAIGIDQSKLIEIEVPEWLAKEKDFI